MLTVCNTHNCGRTDVLELVFQLPLAVCVLLKAYAEQKHEHLLNINKCWIWQIVLFQFYALGNEKQIFICIVYVVHKGS